MVTVAQLIYKDRLWWWLTLCRERCQDCRKPIQEVSFHSQHTHRCLSYICHHFVHLTLFSNPDCQVLTLDLIFNAHIMSNLTFLLTELSKESTILVHHRLLLEPSSTLGKKSFFWNFNWNQATNGCAYVQWLNFFNSLCSIGYILDSIINSWEEEIKST